MTIRVCLSLALALVCAPAAVALPLHEPAASPFYDSVHECLEFVPEAVSIAGVSDDGSEIAVEALVVLDGITRSVGRRIIQVANESYAPIAVTLVPRFRSVHFEHDGLAAGMDEEVGPTGDIERLRKEGKKLFDGRRPEGTDVVLFLTNKDLFLRSGDRREYSVGGRADCIGGIRWDEHAFAIAEGITPWSDVIGQDAGSAIAAHEVGHLLGAHHHYGNCHEGDVPNRPCTLMWQATIELVSRNFGTLESATIRGHAVDYAN